MTASTASEASLAKFCFRAPPIPKCKIACWDSPKPLFRKNAAALWKITNAHHPTRPDNSREMTSDEHMLQERIKRFRCIVRDGHPASLKLPIIVQPLGPSLFLVPVCLDPLLAPGVHRKRVLPGIGKVLDLMNFFRCTAGSRPRHNDMQTVRMDVQPSVGQIVRPSGAIFPNAAASGGKSGAVPLLL